MSFSELLKQCRKKQGVSQAELASRLGVTQQAVGKWESGKSSPDPSTVARIAELLNTTADYLLGLYRPVSNVSAPEERFFGSPLKSDIFTIRKYIREFNDINVIKEKDFVTHPKESGYTSYHMVVKVPVAIDNDISMVKVEIQIRSLAMDFWASLEHKIKYKPNGEINEDVSKELVKCARDINKLDNKMIKLFKK